MEAAKALRPGRHSQEPVQTEFGWHVIQLVSAKPVKKPPFDAVRDGLRQQVVSERVEAQVLKLRDDVHIACCSHPDAPPSAARFNAGFPPLGRPSPQTPGRPAECVRGACR